MQVKIINQSTNALPQYATKGSSGLDLRAFIAEPICLQPLQRILVSTGIFIELPIGYEAQIRPRSGMALNFGITCLNTPGTIDADYRGEIKVLLINLSNQNYTINNADKIAQMVIQKIEQIEWLAVDVINNTTRGDGGFGHSGIN